MTPSPRRSTRNTSSSNDLQQRLDNLKKDLIETLKSELADIKSQLSTLGSRIDDLEGSLKTVVSTQSLFKEDLVNLKEKIKAIDEENRRIVNEFDIDEISKELERRHAKRFNVIISGLQESQFGTVDERKWKDANQVKAIARELKVDHYEIKDVYRVGGNARRPRLACVVFKEVSMKNEFLRKARTLRDSVAFKNCYINPDLTFNQRMKERDLRKLLKEKKDAGYDVIIKDGKLVERNEQSRGRLQNFQ